MMNRKLSLIAYVVATTLLLSLANALPSAAAGAPMTPEYAAKKENVRKQHEQRISNGQRRNAGADLKAKRLEVYRARQAKQTKQAQPEKNENK